MLAYAAIRVFYAALAAADALMKSAMLLSYAFILAPRLPRHARRYVYAFRCRLYATPCFRHDTLACCFSGTAQQR